MRAIFVVERDGYFQRAAFSVQRRTRPQTEMENDGAGDAGLLRRLVSALRQKQGIAFPDGQKRSDLFADAKGFFDSVEFGG